jgi:hypothetical protein
VLVAAVSVPGTRPCLMPRRGFGRVPGEHLDMGSLMARQASVDHNSQPQTTMHLDPGRCAPSDD